MLIIIVVQNQFPKYGDIKGCIDNENTYLEHTAKRRMQVGPTFEGVMWIFPLSLIRLFRISFKVFGPEVIKKGKLGKL